MSIVCFFMLNGMTFEVIDFEKNYMSGGRGEIPPGWGAKSTPPLARYGSPLPNQGVYLQLCNFWCAQHYIEEKSGLLRIELQFN